MPIQPAKSHLDRGLREQEIVSIGSNVFINTEGIFFMANGVFGSWANAQGFFTNTVTDSINVNILTVNSITANNIISNTQTVANLSGNNLTANNITANNGNIVTLGVNVISVGNSTINATMNSTALGINSISTNVINIGNSTVNAAANSTAFRVNSISVNVISVGNSTVNTTINSSILVVGSISIASSGDFSNSVKVGNSTVNATMNSTAFSLNGEPIRSAGMVLLNSGSLAAGGASLSIVLPSLGTYSHYKIVLTQLVPATDATTLHMRTSTDGGSTWAQGSTDYGHIEQFAIANSTSSASGQGGTFAGGSSIEFGGNFESGASGTASVEITIYNPQGTSRNKLVRADVVKISASSEIAVSQHAGVRWAVADIDAVLLFMSSGNISVQNWRLYGII